MFDSALDEEGNNESFELDSEDSSVDLEEVDGNSFVTSENKRSTKIRSEPNSDDWRGRIKRRNVLIDVIRKAYLSDVITIKYVILNVLTKNERADVFQEYNDRVPSLDLTHNIDLYSPPECSFVFKPCPECGGSAEIVHRESKEMERLSKTLQETLKRDEELRVVNATQHAQLEKVGSRLAQIEKSHSEEKLYLFREIKDLKSKLQDSETEVAALQARNQKLYHECNSLKHTAETSIKLNEELMTSNDTIFRQKNSILSLEDEIRHLNEKMSNMENHIDKKKDIIETFTRKNEELQGELNETKGELREASKSLRETEKKAESLSQQLEEMTKNFNSTKKEKESTSKELEASKRKTKEKIKSLELLNEKLRMSAKILEDTVNEYKKQLEESKNRLLENETLSKSLTDKLADVQTIEKETQDKMNALSAEVGSLQTQTGSLSSENEELKGQVTALTTEVQRLQTENTELKARPVAPAATDVPVGQQPGRKYAIKKKSPATPALLEVVKLTNDESMNKLKQEMQAARNRQIAMRGGGPVDDDGADDPMVEELLKAVAAVMGPTGAALVRDTLRPLLGKFSKSYVTALKTMLETLQFAKRNSDMTYRLLHAFSGILQFPGTDFTTQKVDSVMKDFFYSERVWPKGWVDECGFEPEFVEAVSAKANPSTGEVSFPSYLDFFGEDADTRRRRVGVAVENIDRFLNYNDSGLHTLSEALPQVMEEWYTIKSAYLTALATAEDQKQSMKEEQDKIVAGLMRELGDSTNHVSRLKADVNVLEVQVLQQNSQLVELRPVKALLTETREQLAKTLLSRNELMKELENLRASHEKHLEDTSRKSKFLTEDLEDRKNVLKMTKEMLDASNTKLMDLKERLEKETFDHNNVRNSFNEMKERERHRIEELNDVYVQCDPDVADMAIQTEFVVPAMYLRHSVNVPGSAAKQKIFPVVRATTAFVTPRTSAPSTSHASTGMGMDGGLFGGESIISDFRYPRFETNLTTPLRSTSALQTVDTELSVAVPDLDESGSPLKSALSTFPGSVHERDRAATASKFPPSNFNAVAGGTGGGLPYVANPYGYGRIQTQMTGRFEDSRSGVEYLASTPFQQSSSTAPRKNNDSRKKRVMVSSDHKRREKEVREWERWDAESRISSRQEW